MIKEFVKKGRKTKGEGANKKTIGRGIKIGVLVGDVSDGDIIIGHSKWHKVLDSYDRSFGEKVAIDRMQSGSKTPPALSIAKAYLKFIERCKRYYKTDRVSKNVKDAIDKLNKNADICAKKNPKKNKTASKSE